MRIQSMLKRFLGMTTAIILLSLLQSHATFAQEPPDEKAGWNLPEGSFFLPEDEQDNVAIEESGEAWEELLRDPVRVNEKEPMDLARLFFLSHEQLDRLFQYMIIYGPLLSIYELQAIEGFDPGMARRLSKVIRLDSRTPLPWSSEAIATARSRQELRLNAVGHVEKINEFMKAMDDTAYLSSPVRLRYNYSLKLSNGLEFALAGTKDLQDFFQKRARLGLSFNSGNLSYKGKGFVKRFVVGDFQLATGQGLMLWNAFMAGYSGVADMGLQMTGRGLVPVAKSSTAAFFRGAALWLQWKSIQIIPFFSDPGPYSQSLNSGRTIGVVTAWRAERLEIGASWSHIEPYASHIESFLVSAESFSGRMALSRLGSNFKYRLRKFLFYGEVTSMQQRMDVVTYLGGSDWKALPGLVFSLQIHDFPWFTNEALSNSSFRGKPCTNSRGLLLATKFQTTDKLQWYCRLERSATPWLVYRLSAPGISTNVSISAVYADRNKNKMNFRLTHKKWETNESGSLDVSKDIQAVQQYDFQMSLQHESILHYACKMHYLANNKAFGEWQQGWLIYQQMGMVFFQNNLQITFGYALFDTDGWGARLYLNTGSTSFFQGFQAMAGQGQKTLLQIRFKIQRKMEVSAFYSRLVYADKENSGADPASVSGSYSSNVGFQLKVLW